MGNCINLDKNLTHTLDFTDLDWEDLFGNFTENYGEGDDYTCTEPCQYTYCSVFSSSIPAFLAVAGTLGLLCNMALVITLAKYPLFWGKRHAGKTKIFLMATAAAVFGAVLPFLAVEMGPGQIFGDNFCPVARALKYGCVFAQGLLVAGSAWKMSWRFPGLLLPIVLWLVGFLCGIPAGISSSTGEFCIPSQEVELYPWSLAHTIICLVVFVILPLAMILVKAVLKWDGYSSPIDVTWLFYLFWVPYGVALILGELRQKDLVICMCHFQERLDYFLGLSEGLGILHCCLCPVLILGFGFCRQRDVQADKC
ncbi:atypical chemokine receptor 1 [Elgaria multicarinata webbii]|uniref:atypical chemokine receptor 1 n=1 Tax=Elgaria multicarinata webbii TaxID=159646 RepID=UPI002FCD354D